MSESSSDPLVNHVRRLFRDGALGTVSDAELLERIATRGDDAAEAAFEQLVIRHGPMVLRVCRGVLGDAHDAEDAFQATFLVLANRAGSIRRRASLASWLFGVAQRVSGRVQRSNTRRRNLARKLADRPTQDDAPSGLDPDWEVLHAEIAGLPERLRAPVVLCYLEGQNSVAAASQLGLSEPTIRGRLARARERLRQRLAQRGLSTLPAPFVAAGGSVAMPPAVPEDLVASTIRIAVGFTSGNAVHLARGVLKSMLWNQLRVVSVVVLLAGVSVCAAWLTVAMATDDPPAAKPTERPSAKAAPKPTSSAGRAIFTGSVRAEGTGEPVPGARIQLTLGNNLGLGGSNFKTVETGLDGRFTAEVNEGPVRTWLSDLPAGYLVRSVDNMIQNLTVEPGQAALEHNYQVRRGTIWAFRFTRGADQKPSTGYVAVRATNRIFSRAFADERGEALLTLPAERSKVALNLLENDPTAARINTGRLDFGLEWDDNFQPNALRDVERLPGTDRRFRLEDADERSAILELPEVMEPVREAGRLVIRVAFRVPTPRDLVTVTGKVIDERGQPVAGARVEAATVGLVASASGSPQSVTDDRGEYRLTDIPRNGIDGKPLLIRIAVSKQGHATSAAPVRTFEHEAAQILDPIRLERGVAIGGIVVDHRGQPVPGATVQAAQTVFAASQPGNPYVTRADANGRFRLDALRVGTVRVMIIYGTVHASQFYFVDGTPIEARVALPDPANPQPPPALVAPPPPLAVGQPAAEWKLGPWSDGRDHPRSGEAGNVVVLYFWGVSFPPSVEGLSLLGTLANDDRARGVTFLTIHNAEPDEAHTREQALRVLAYKNVRLPVAVDRTQVPGHARGQTAHAYGVQSPPVIVVIDRQGKIAFRTDVGVDDPPLARLLRSPGRNRNGVVDQSGPQRVEQILREEIDRALRKQD